MHREILGRGVDRMYGLPLWGVLEKIKSVLNLLKKRGSVMRGRIRLLMADQKKVPGSTASLRFKAELAGAKKRKQHRTIILTGPAA